MYIVKIHVGVDSDRVTHIIINIFFVIENILIWQVIIESYKFNLVLILYNIVETKKRYFNWNELCCPRMIQIKNSTISEKTTSYNNNIRLNWAKKQKGNK